METSSLRFGRHADSRCCSKRSGDELRSRPKQLPLVGNAFELVGAVALEFDTRAGNEVLYRSRHHHPAGGSEVSHSRGDMYRDALHIAFNEMYLAGVEPGPYFEFEWLNA